MNLNLMNQLAKEYPECFKALSKPKPPFLPIQFGLDVNTGWDNLVITLLKQLESEIKKLPEQERQDTYLFQIKEKFGGLRCYMSQSNDAIDNFIHAAEKLSFITCEKCGDTATQRIKHGWISTQCDKCFKG